MQWKLKCPTRCVSTSILPPQPLLRPKREAYWALNTHAYVCRASPPRKEGDKTVAVHLRRVVKCSRKLLWEGGTAYEKRFWGGWLPLHGQPFYSWSTWTGSRWRCEGVLDLFIGRGGKGDVGIETTDVLCFIHI